MAYNKNTWVNGITPVDKDIMNNIENGIYNLDQSLNNGAAIIPTVAYGMNSKITNTGKTSVSPRFTMIGKTVINLLGKDGNCEDVSKWTDSSTTHILDSTNKVFGLNGIKITNTSTTGYILKTGSSFNIDVTKYYFMSAYVKNGNATNIGILKDSTGGGTNVLSSLITDTTKFNRIGVVFQPTDMNVANWFTIKVTGSSTQYAYVDGIMINEITAAEYALGATALLDKYPYVDSYSCLQNPYIEIRHDNLVRNGNGEEGIGWWIPQNSDTSLSIENSKFKVTSINGSACMYQAIPVKPNTDYYVKGNVTAGTATPAVKVYSPNFGGLITSTNTFNSGINTVVWVIMQPSVTGYCYFDSIQLIEGTIAPPQYLPQRLERTVIEGKFTSEDSFTYDNGEMSGLRTTKHPVLFGKDYDWVYTSDQSGYKTVEINANASLSGQNANNEVCVKYNGNILKTQDSGSFTVSDSINCASSGQTWLSVADADSGWAEAIQPNNDEVKAFMNGWKAIVNNGTRYTQWSTLNATTSMLQNDYTSYPPGTSSYASIAGSGNTVTVFDINPFKVGDTITAYGYGLGTISGIAGNVITVTVTQGTFTCPINTTISRIDVPATDSRILNYCKNNVAPGYEGYQLHYKLANPEPITDANTSIQGDIPKFDVGDNYLYLDSGIVLGEVAHPIYNGSATYINLIDGLGNPIVYGTQFKNKDELLNAIYKNGIYNNNVWTIDNSVSSYGNQRASMAGNSNLDTNAQYTVDYKILATQAPQIGSIACSYSQDIVSAIIDLKEEVGSRQAKDSALDTLVDLSVYESLNSMVPCSTFNDGTNLYVDVHIIFRGVKKVRPLITLKKITIVTGKNGGNDISNKLIVGSVTTTSYGVVFRMSVADATLVTDVRSYGIIAIADYVADCRGRI